MKLHFSLYLLLSTLSLIALGLVSACGSNYPKCDNDDDCVREIKDKSGKTVKVREYCINGTCQQCRTGRDCKQGYECDKGLCRQPVGFCRSDRDCRPGQKCSNNRCQNKADENAQWDLQKKDDSGACSLEPVYFDFDSDTIRVEGRTTLQNNAKCIRERKLSGVQVVGFTDSRGTEEYNLALGERRARSTLNYLKSLNVDDKTLSASSVGEELASGTEESTWSKDRKVEFQTK